MASGALGRAELVLRRGPICGGGAVVRKLSLSLDKHTFTKLDALRTTGESVTDPGKQRTPSTAISGMCRSSAFLRVLPWPVTAGTGISRGGPQKATET